MKTDLHSLKVYISIDKNRLSRGDLSTVNLFIMTFVITAKFDIMSIWTSQKSADLYFFIDSPMLFFKQEDHSGPVLLP